MTFYPLVRDQCLEQTRFDQSVVLDRWKCGMRFNELNKRTARQREVYILHPYLRQNIIHSPTIFLSMPTRPCASHELPFDARTTSMGADMLSSLRSFGHMHSAANGFREQHTRHRRRLFGFDAHAVNLASFGEEMNKCVAIETSRERCAFLCGLGCADLPLTQTRLLLGNRHRSLLLVSLVGAHNKT
jgi:hypothetical protein